VPVYAPTGSPGLGRAALHGFQAVVEALLAWQNIDVNAVDDDGNTALHNAAFSGHQGVVELLLINNAKNGILNQAGRVAANCTNISYLREILRNPSLISNRER
jgi:ankyrin repeat protein